MPIIKLKNITYELQKMEKVLLFQLINVKKGWEGFSGYGLPKIIKFPDIEDANIENKLFTVDFFETNKERDEAYKNTIEQIESLHNYLEEKCS